MTGTEPLSLIETLLTEPLCQRSAMVSGSRTTSNAPRWICSTRRLYRLAVTTKDPNHTLGNPVARIEDLPLVTGRGRFAADIDADRQPRKLAAVVGCHCSHLDLWELVAAAPADEPHFIFEDDATWHVDDIRDWFARHVAPLLPEDWAMVFLNEPLGMADGGDGQGLAARAAAAADGAGWRAVCAADASHPFARCLIEMRGPPTTEGYVLRRAAAPSWPSAEAAARGARRPSRLVAVAAAQLCTGVASAPIELAIDICSLAGPATGEAGRSSLSAAVKLPPPPPLPPSPRPTLATTSFAAAG